eukprot:gene20869-biopygen11629
MPTNPLWVSYCGPAPIRLEATNPLYGICLGLGPQLHGPNPRHMGGFFERRLQAYGRGRIAGGPTPDIWGARGSGPYNSAWGPHGQVGFVASRRVGTP